MVAFRTLSLLSILLLLFAELMSASRVPPFGSSNGSIVFTDVTVASGITFKHVFAPEKKYILESMSGGVALFDYNNDGWMDIYFVNSPTVATADDAKSARSELWRNNGDGTFANVTEKAAVGYPGWGMGVCTGDFDNNGWEDLYVTCYGANHLYRNNGDGTFTDVAQRAGVAEPRWSTGAAFGDYNNDGWLDLYVANYVDIKLDSLPEFGKDRHCQFQGLPVQCGPRGLPGAGDALYLNNGNGTFTDVGLESGTALSEDGKEQSSMGVTIGDYDHRGRWSIFVTNFSDEYNAFYRHEKDFQFTDVSYATQTGRVSLPFVGWGCGLFDFDNDGWLDLMVANGHVYPQLAAAKLKIAYPQRKLFYRNNRNGTFAEIGAEVGPAMNEPSVSRGAAFGDLDNDGDVDVVINNIDGAPTVLRNDGGNKNHFVVISLVGSKSNRSAFGARVKVIAGDLVQAAERRSGGSYISQNDTRLHFGLEKRTKVDAIEVRWSNGAVERFTSIPADTFISIREGEGSWKEAKKK
jgi:enediyne biosynthesis protein E4